MVLIKLYGFCAKLMCFLSICTTCCKTARSELENKRMSQHVFHWINDLVNHSLSLNPKSMNEECYPHKHTYQLSRSPILVRLE